MPLTPQIAVEFVAAIREQMSRCPGCHGIGQTRPTGALLSMFCLVCEEVARAMYPIDRGWLPGHVPRLDPVNDVKAYAEFVKECNRALYEAREFAKRCPGCFGVRRVWGAEKIRGCLVCQRLHAALDAYEMAVNPADPSPMFVADDSSPRLFGGRQNHDDGDP